MLGLVAVTIIGCYDLIIIELSHQCLVGVVLNVVVQEVSQVQFDDMLQSD